MRGIGDWVPGSAFGFGPEKTRPRRLSISEGHGMKKVHEIRASRWTLVTSVSSASALLWQDWSSPNVFQIQFQRQAPTAATIVEHVGAGTLRRPSPACPRHQPQRCRNVSVY